MNVKLLILLFVASTVWAAAPTPQPHVQSAAEIAWEAIPDTISDSDQVRMAREYLENNPNDIPLLRSVQNILNRKSDLTLDFWTERMNANPSSANRYLYARKAGDPEIMKIQADQIMKDDPENFWGYYLAAVAELSKDEPDFKSIASYFEQAIAKDPSRPEGWENIASTYEELKDYDNALRAYDACMVVNPEDKYPLMGKMGIYAKKRDADNYFKMCSTLLPKDPPLEMNLERYNSDAKFTAGDLSHDYTVLEIFAFWCGPCVRMALPEANKLSEEGKLPFAFYPVHAEGKNEGGLALMDSNDVTGRAWHLNFVFSDKAFNERLGVTAYPTYYVIDDHAQPVAFLVGYGDDTIDLLEWLIIQAKKRS